MQSIRGISMAQKVSIRFYNDHEVRAVWSESERVLDWFTYSDNTIDGQSKRKAYTLFESNLLDTIPKGTVKDSINDRKMFMKGIDYSYYYEQEDGHVEVRMEE